jgi:hypothetical protein
MRHKKGVEAVTNNYLSSGRKFSMAKAKPIPKTTMTIKISQPVIFEPPGV